MLVVLYVMTAIILLSLLSRLIWRRSLLTTCIASLTRMINIRAKFKEDEAGTRRRIEHMQEKKYEVPKYFKPSFSLKERVIRGMRVFFLNEETKSDRVLFYIHGGGWVEEISWLHWKFLNRIAKLTDAKIIIPLYPLAPFYTYKDTFPSIVELYRTMIQENPNKKMIIAGDSAGGNIAAVLAECLTKEEQPDELILLSAALRGAVNPQNQADIECFKKDTLVGYEALGLLAEYWAQGKENMSDPLVNPFYGDVSRLKRVTIMVGERDMGYVMGLEFSGKLSAEGVDVTTIVGRGMNHVWPVQPVPEAGKAQRLIADIIMR